ncbi:MAG: 50S ribosomal protein L21 [Bacteroidetes bacterium]|mgnify:CR=1 FL=1|jgi:large subunit ribosomal protein L21|nr:50S ribosomal protein L21 [Bacteroidota bacterium]
MYAIVEIAGQQFKVEEGKKIFVHRLDAEEEKEIKFEQVLLIEEEGKVTVGEPFISDSFVECKVLGHARGKKVIVFKKKRRKGYRVKNGHRQDFTEVEIISINGKKSAEKKTVKKEPAVTAGEPKDETKSAEKKPATKKPAVKKPAGKKPAAKSADKGKTTAKKTAPKKADKGEDK